MKRNLVEEIKRIHSLTYKKNITEEFDLDFLKDLLVKLGIDDSVLSKFEKNDDLLQPSIDDVLETLESIKNNGVEISSTDDSSKKKIQAIQASLAMLGFDLEKYGVDGKFGDETKSALDDFKQEYLNKDNISESKTNVGPFRTDLENGPSNHGSRALGNWQSDNAWDLFAPLGTVVNSFTDGVVTNKRESGSSNPKIFGTQLSIKGENGYPSIFYTHIENVDLKKGDRVKIGDYIGTIKQWPKHDPKMNHVHIGLPRGKHLKELLKNSNKIFTMSRSDNHKSDESIESNEINKDVVEKMISLLKSKNFKDEDVLNVLTEK